MIYLITGPGSHAHTLVDVLKQLGKPITFAWHYPKFVIETYDEKGNLIDKKTNRLVSVMVWLIWGIKSKLHYQGNAHLSWHYAVYGWACKWYFPPTTQKLIAWPQVSLPTIRKAKRKKIPVFLEYPMAHPIFWNHCIAQEKQRFGIKVPLYSFFNSHEIKKLEREIVLSDSIHVLSQFAKKTFTDAGVPHQKLTVYPLPIASHWHNKPGSKKDIFPHRLLYVGRLELLKGVPYLLQAFAILPKEDFTLVLAGDIKPEMKSFFASLPENIHLVGQQTPEQLSDLYQNSSILVHPTLNEAFGLVITEALHYDLPVISTPYSCAPDFYEDGGNIAIVDPRNQSQFVENIQNMIIHKEKLRHIKPVIHYNKWVKEWLGL